jgi:hypothetical protein
MSVRTPQKRLLTRIWRSISMRVPIENAVIGVLVGGMLFGLGFAGTRTSAGGAVTHYIVTTVLRSDSRPTPSPVVGNDAVTGSLTDPTPSPVVIDVPPVSPDPTPAPIYPIAHGAPCGPPGVITAQGDCVTPVGYVAPPTINPAANQPGHGAPCTAPNVLVGLDCISPAFISPTPTPTPIAAPVATPPVTIYAPTPAATPPPVTAAPSPSPSPVPSP